ncbi:LysR family transcriptional regulator [Actinoplanes sp. CA-252034]|uniref:LysR family transcriptional regulator n=1 Tax=Actinoplanes sp. CA-252034 TaxID=3239906 RepID=UPI003D980F8F
MNERELQAFVSVAQHGRMDLAARSLGYSQPAVSYQIKCLEQTLGTRLFARNTNGAVLTRAGRLMLPSAQAVLVLMAGIKTTTTVNVPVAA